MRREANRVVDRLANEGVIYTRENKCLVWENVQTGQLCVDYSTLVRKDREHHQNSRGNQLAAISNDES